MPTTASCLAARLISPMLVASALAQVTYTDLPSCAITCFGNNLPSNASSPGCSLQSNLDFEATFSPCFYTACSPKEALTALNVTSIICDAPVRDISIDIRAFVVTATVVAAIVIAIRVVLKYRGLGGGIGWDDWMIVMGVAGTTVAAIGQFLAASYGLGRDAWKISFESHALALKSFYAAAVGYKLGTAAIRISLLCFYLRIFMDRKFRITAYSFIVFNALIGVGFTLADTLQCSPPSNFWNSWDGEHGGQCNSLGAISWAHSILNILLDVVTLGMAVWMVRHLNMRWRKKAAVIGMFALGSAITLVSFLRLQSLPELSNNRNWTWDLGPISYWSGIEMLSGMICACLPAMRVLGSMCCGGGRNKDGSSKKSARNASGNQQRHTDLSHRARPADPTLTFSENEAVDVELRPRSLGDDSVSELVVSKKAETQVTENKI